MAVPKPESLTESFPGGGRVGSPSGPGGGRSPSLARDPQGLTWQGADEFVDIFHIPLGGLAWQEVVSHAH